MLFNEAAFSRCIWRRVPWPETVPGRNRTLENHFQYFETQHFDVYEGSYFGTRWNFDSFIESVSFIKKCFNFTYGKYQEPTNWRECVKNQNLSVESNIKQIEKKGKVSAVSIFLCLKKSAPKVKTLRLKSWRKIHVWPT